MTTKLLMSLDAGTQLGRYEIRSKLGEGGMGEVYLARDTSELERTVALKFLPAAVASDLKRLQRFIQEARTVSALNHPNILTIYEFGQVDSVRFIATEYVDGVTLRDYIRGRLLKLHEVLDIAAQIAAALNAAHEAGVVHRDIKPENIMIRRDHIVKVLDFGLAKLTMKEAEGVPVDSEAGTKVLVHTEPGLVMGTASYMSPEQSQGSARVDHRTDIWSLGVVLYEMIAGRLPFEGKDIHRQVIAIQEEASPPLSKFAEGVPARLEEIVEKALAKDPDERYQTAKDLLIDLRNLKRKLDVDAEIERTVAPELRSTASGAQGTVAGAQQSAAQTTPVGQAKPTSSAEYIVSQIKQHKRGAALIAFSVLF
ncbi:MAG: serine/threonine protein kinase, partial [Acidobacteriota bacterium]|nr:serine/threonine protein kinase [Acidobacteriota bacterium]